MPKLSGPIIFLFVGFYLPVYPQEFKNQKKSFEERDSISNHLKSLAKRKIPGLKETIDFSVSGVSLKEFIRAIAETASLNVHIEENVQGRVSNNFSGESTLNILLFLIDHYQLQLNIQGTILSFSKRNDSTNKKKRKPDPIIHYSPFDNQLNLEVDKDTLSRVLKEITIQSGINVLPSPSIKTRIVSGFLKELQFEAAIEKFAFTNGLISEETRDGSFLLFEALHNTGSGQKPEKSARGKIFNQNFTRPGTGFFLELDSESGQQLVSAELDDIPIFDVLQVLSERSPKNYIFFSTPTGTINLKVQSLEHDKFLNYILQGTAFTYSYKDGVYLIGERQREGLRSSELVQFRYRPVEDLIESIPTELSREVEIKVFEELNGLLISGSKPKIEEIKDFIGPLDRLVPLILIELVAIDVKKGRDVETGIKAGVSDSIKSGGTLLPGLNFTFSSSSINNLSEVINTKGMINLGKVNPNFYTTLQALEKNNHIKIRSTPKLATLNGHEASLTIGQKEYYLEQTQNIQGANNVVTTITPQYREINADLNIQIDPMVSSGDHVTLDITAEFSSFTDPFVLNGPPGKSTRRFESIIRVRNEEMIVLGGLEEIRKTKQSEGVPFLSRIPVIKWLFSSVNNEKSESRLMVFIKPTIVY